MAYIMSNGSITPTGSNQNSIFTQMVGNDEFIQTQYELVDGNYPKNDNEILISVDENNKISDYVLYALGIRDAKELADYNKALTLHKEDPENNPAPELPVPTKYTYKDILEYRFRVLLDSDLYKIENGLIKEKTVEEKTELLKSDKAIELKVVGIVKPSEKSQTAMAIGGILYKKEMMTGFIEKVNSSEVVDLQKNNTKTNLLYNRDFDNPYTSQDYMILMAQISKDYSLLTQFANLYGAQALLEQEKVIDFANQYMLSTHEDVLKKLGYVDFSTPDSINIYPKDFDAKTAIMNDLNSYNDKQTDDDKILFSDIVGELLKSVSIIIDAISYVLIAFVSISLVVSSIMIGIITYISVLERTKEIGVLRAIGASKKDISRVFNAETLAIGFGAGLLGIGVTLLLIIPINIILHAVTKISYLSASLPLVGAIILVLISMFLTFIAGLIPSRIAAKKDPVIALRTE